VNSTFEHALGGIAKGSLLLAILTGCAMQRPSINAGKALKDMPEKLIEEPEQPETFVTTQWLPESAFTIRKPENPQPLPNKRIKHLSVTEAGLYDVIQLLFEDTSVAVTFEGGTDNMRRYGPVTAYNLQGSLTDVMNQLANSMGFFWSFQNNTLTIESEQQFIIELPPILNDDNLAGLSNTFQYLGVRDSFLERNGRSMVFRANRKVLRNVEDYLTKVRQSRSMIIYDLQILQVDLKDGSRMGIRWNRYTKAADQNAASTTASTTDSSSKLFSNLNVTSANTGFDVFLVGRTFQNSTLIEFLNTQGTVKSLSKPRMGVMSGTKGSLRVGQTTTIVAKVGRDLSSTISQTTVETKDVKTGLDLNIFGEEHDSTIYTRINISITELLRLTRYQALGIDLNLPELADREMKTQVRSRPGDTILLGGIVINKAENDRSIGSAINQSIDDVQQSELVIVIRPRLVIFSNAKSLENESKPTPEEQREQGEFSRGQSLMGTKLPTTLSVEPTLAATKLPAPTAEAPATGNTSNTDNTDNNSPAPLTRLKQILTFFTHKPATVEDMPNSSKESGQ
jgi:hypothetical protein